MQSLTAGQLNTLVADVVDRTTGNPVTTGIVNGYLRAMDGTNAKKWWNGATSSWSAGKVSAGEMTHVDDGHWELDVMEDAWVTGTRYRFYWQESINLHISVSEDVVEVHAPMEVSFEAAVAE